MSKEITKKLTNLEQFQLLQKIKTEVVRMQGKWNQIATYIKKFRPKGSKNQIAINGTIMQLLPESVVFEIRDIIDKYASEVDSERKETVSKIDKLEKELNSKK